MLLAELAGRMDAPWLTALATHLAEAKKRPSPLSPCAPAWDLADRLFAGLEAEFRSRFAEFFLKWKERFTPKMAAQIEAAKPAIAGAQGAKARAEAIKILYRDTALLMSNDIVKLPAMAQTRALQVQDQVAKAWLEGAVSPSAKLFPVLEQSFRSSEEAHFSKIRKNLEAEAAKLFTQDFFSRTAPPTSQGLLLRYLQEVVRSAELATLEMLHWYRAKWSLYTRAPASREMNLFQTSFLQET
jgi:hypothetical protein